jgi:hypothetical protein
MHLDNELSLGKSAGFELSLELLKKGGHFVTSDRREVCDGSQILNPLLAANQELATLQYLEVSVALG